MRFLLTPARRSVTRIARTKGEKRPRSESLLPDHANPVSINNKDDKVLKMNSWGQQCSPSCGCVLRFESNVDPSKNTVVGSSYSAKAVVATKSKDGYLKPVLTTRNSKPRTTIPITTSSVCLWFLSGRIDGEEGTPWLFLAFESCAVRPNSRHLRTLMPARSSKLLCPMLL